MHSSVVCRCLFRLIHGDYFSNQIMLPKYDRYISMFEFFKPFRTTWMKHSVKFQEEFNRFTFWFFSFSKPIVITLLKSLLYPSIAWENRKINVFLNVISSMRNSRRIWTRIADSISYDDNYFPTNTFILVYIVINPSNVGQNTPTAHLQSGKTSPQRVSWIWH